MADRKKPRVIKQKCIFCGSLGPLTQEHIWGDWLKAYVRATINKHHFRSTRINPRGTPDTSNIALRAGSPLRSKVRVVCQKCNNGWLSVIQKNAKTHLIPLIDGRATVLGKDAQQKIAAWCAMATMTAEFMKRDPETIAVPQHEREWLWKNGTAPPNWRIWIGRYQRHKWVGQWVHIALPVLESKDIPNDGTPTLPNTQVTTFVVGQLYIHVMSCLYPEIVTQWTWGWGPAPEVGRLLVQISPLKESLIAWPPASLTDQSADLIASAFDRYITLLDRSILGLKLH